jgi:hypothetical protein
MGQTLMLMIVVILFHYTIAYYSVSELLVILCFPLLQLGICGATVFQRKESTTVQEYQLV